MINGYATPHFFQTDVAMYLSSHYNYQNKLYTCTIKKSYKMAAKKVFF